MSLDYNYKGAFVPVKVKVIQFHDLPDYILSIDQWNLSGGWNGLIKSGEIQLRDVKQVIDGEMSPIDFDNLPEWEA